VLEIFLRTTFDIINTPRENLRAFQFSRGEDFAMSSPSFARDISPLFTDEDVAHMAYAFDLRSRDNVQAHSADILDRVSRPAGDDGIMPPPPRDPWTRAQVKLFSDWIAGGYQP
jgi:hypothetical protein